MKRTKIVSLVVALIALFVFSTSVSADTQTGWSQDSDGNWSYVGQDGTPYEKGIYQIEGNFYLFADGIMLDDDSTYYCDNTTGIGAYYYAKPGGALARGEWIYRYNNWYYYTSDGSAANGWLYVGDRWYYFGYAGYMYRNHTLVDADGRTYVFDDDGYYVEINKNGWTNVFGTWYYGENGQLAEGVKLVNGNYYFFSGGYMLTGGSYEYNGHYITPKQTAFLPVTSGFITTVIGIIILMTPPKQPVYKV